MDPVLIINFVLCIIVLTLGYLGYEKTKNLLPLYIGIAFLLYAISHMLGIFGLGIALEIPLIIIRILGYLLVIYALYKFISQKAHAIN